MMSYYSMNQRLSERNDAEVNELIQQTINICECDDKVMLPCAFVDGTMLMGYSDGHFIACNYYVGYKFKTFQACAIFLCATARVDIQLWNWFYEKVRERFEDGQI